MALEDNEKVAEQPHPSHLKSVMSRNGEFEIPLRPISDVPGVKTTVEQTTVKSELVIKDVTSDFASATSALKTGQLVKDDWFTLFESVGALEVMDAKMDSGLLAEGETFEDEYDISQPLSPEQVLGIMDEMLCHEMGWLMGYPLSQTLFTSLYLENILWPVPSDLKQAQFKLKMTLSSENDSLYLVNSVLWSYCIATIKSCDIVHKQIQQEHYYEEEDFVSNLYNRELLPWLQPVKCWELLNKAIRLLKENLTTDSLRVRQALCDRLELRRNILAALPEDLQRLDRVTSSQAWDRCRNLITSISESSPIGIKVPESFSIKIQRKLASTIPPRPIVDLNFESAMAHLAQMCIDGRDLLKLFEYNGATNYYASVWYFMARKPHPSVYIRALLQSMMFDTVDSVKLSIIEELRDFLPPANILLDPSIVDVEVTTDPRHDIHNQMDVFIGRTVQSYVDMYRCICQNRSRTRRTLCHTLQDWDLIYEDALQLNRDLLPSLNQALGQGGSYDIFTHPLAWWASHHRSRQSMIVLQMGFELDIYQPDEFASMYWFLSTLAYNHVGLIVAVFDNILKPETQVKTSQGRAEMDDRLRHLSYINLFYRVTHQLATALTSFYTLLKRLSLMPTFERPYSTDALRYELRMKPFFLQSEQIVNHFEEHCIQVEQRFRNDKELLDFIKLMVQRSRQDFEALLKMDPEQTRTHGCRDEWNADIKDAVRACIATNISLSIIETAVNTETLHTIKVDIPPPRGDAKERPKGNYHDWWVVPKVTYL